MECGAFHADKFRSARDGAGERLWYIVDPAFLSSATAMNSAILPTTLSFNGNNLVAVILSPGLALGEFPELF